jgi:lipopolysaccharide assembly protein A
LKYLMWLLNAAIFFVLFAFALNNQDSVTLNLFFGASWQAPLVLVILVALVLGVFLGVLVMLPLWLRAKRSRRRAASAAAASTSFDADSTLFPDPTDRRHGL